MKRENKKIAQERRIAQRKKQVRKNMLDKVIRIGIPSLLLAAIVVFCIINPFGKEDTVTEQDEATTFSVDTSLAIEDGDKVNIDYVGSIDGVEFEGGNTNSEGTDLVIGSGSYIDDFEEQLIGAHPGDIVDVNVTFPKDYKNKELQGKDALFKVVINGIY